MSRDRNAVVRSYDTIDTSARGRDTEDAINRSLRGKRILVTRTREQASVLSERLRELGAVPVEFPTIRVEPPQDWEELDNALRRLYLTNNDGVPYYNWLILTSANGVRICCERLHPLGLNTQVLSGVRVAAIGPATAAALKTYGIVADLTPQEYIAEEVATAIIADASQRGESLAGKRILLARAAEARKVLVTELQQAGAQVDEVAAYFTRTAASNDEQGQHVLQLLQSGQIDVVTFTSSSTVRNFMHWLQQCEQEDNQPYVSLVTQPSSQLKVACIGPITAQTAQELGLSVHIQAREYTIDGLVDALVQTIYS